MNRLRTLALIPARSGSKGVRNKNIRTVGGNPLMSYTIKSAIDSGVCSEVCVSTDSRLYAKIASECGASVPFMRSDENSGDRSKISEVVMEVLDNYRERGKEFDVLILLQPTSPLRNAKDIVKSYRLFLCANLGVSESTRSSIRSLEKSFIKELIQGRSDMEALLSINEARKHPNLMRHVGSQGRLKKLEGFDSESSNRQDYSKVYEINGAIYINAIKGIDKETRFNDNKIPYVMPYTRGIDVDTEEDILWTQLAMRSKL